MFKLKKILNKHNNAPEMEKLNLIGDTLGKKECIYFVRYGELTPLEFTTDKIPAYYVIYNDVAEGDYDNRAVDCIRITSNMIFEVKYSGTSPQLGDRFVLTQSNPNAGYDGISIVENPEDKSHGYVVDSSSLSKNGRVLVRFHCID